MANARSFAEELRQALNRLYDPAFLRKSPLVEALGLSGSANTAGALRDALIAAIEELKLASSPAQFTGRQDYSVLFCRYVQRLTQGDVANQLGLSPRHLRRVQEAALEALADHLRTRYNLLAAMPVAGARSADEAAVDQEIASLGDRLGDACTPIEPAVREALELATRLAMRQGVALQVYPVSPTVSAALPATVLKEIVLNLLMAAIQAVPGGAISLAVGEEGSAVLIELSARTAMGRGSPPGGWDADAVDMAQRLAELYQGQLATLKAANGTAWRARVWLPAGEQILVLAIEDNVDTLQLWERYLQDSRFRLLGETDPTQALTMAQRLRPAVIVLDLMMPGTDGWKLLAQLRNHPATAATPIVVCSVLPQKELALALGASDFIRKPASREVFRAALQRQSEARGLA